MKAKQRNHPKAGTLCVIQSGDLKGTAVKVHNFLVSQFQGKSVESLMERPDIKAMATALKARGFEVTQDTVMVEIPSASPQFLFLDDSELQVEVTKPKLTVVEDSDDTGTASEGDSESLESGEVELDGCPVVSEAVSPDDDREADSEGEADSETGSEARGEPEAIDGDSKPKLRVSKPASKPTNKTRGSSK